MTTKTKAHGFVNEDWKEQLDAGKYDTVGPYIWRKPYGLPGATPICLLPPSTCDKVREFLEHQIVTRCFPQEAAAAAELLKPLPWVE